jgi:hypothetical protein
MGISNVAFAAYLPQAAEEGKSGPPELFLAIEPLYQIMTLWY